MTGKRKKMYTCFILPVFLCLCFASCDPIPKNTGTQLGISFSIIYDKPNANS